jgi:hypothetical protein
MTLKDSRRQLQSVKPEVQLQLHLTAWAPWWILPIAKNRKRCKKMMQGGRKWRKKRQEEGSGNSSTDSVNSGSGPDYQIHIPLGMGPLVRVTYSCLTQSVFRLDRVKSSSCDCPEKVPVDVCSNASCFTCFSSGGSSPEVAEFCPTLRLVNFIVRA